MGLTWLRPWMLWLVLAAAVGLWQRQQGAQAVRAEWTRAELERERQAAADRAEHQRLASAAAARHVKARSAIERRLPGLRRDLAAALRAPVACPAGLAAPAVGDVVVPAAAVDRLRRAGADDAPD